MKKNYLLLLIFLLLGAGTIWYLYTKNDRGTDYDLGWDRRFAVAEEAIHSIFIARRTGETTNLERQGDRWVYDGKYPVSPNVMENLLEAITDVELLFVPPQTATENIVKILASKGIKVEVYGKNREQLKAYYVGGISPDGRATYYIMENAEQPMAVGIPQMEGQLRPRFELTDDDWRDKTVFGYQPEEIRAVSVEYPKQRNKSFRLERKGDHFEVEPFYDNVPPIQRPVSQGRVEGYLVGFESLVAESFSNSYAKKDSVRQTIPFSIVSVTDTEGEEKRVAFYPTYRINTMTGTRKGEYVERYFADVSTGDWMLTQHLVFQEVFQAYEAFFEPAGRDVKD